MREEKERFSKKIGSSAKLEALAVSLLLQARHTVRGSGDAHTPRERHISGGQ